MDASANENKLNFLEFDYTNLQKILQFGRELFQMNATLENGENQINNKMLRVQIKLNYIIIEKRFLLALIFEGCV